jgi:hypothetical protein
VSVVVIKALGSCEVIFKEEPTLLKVNVIGYVVPKAIKEEAVADCNCV